MVLWFGRRLKEAEVNKGLYGERLSGKGEGVTEMAAVVGFIGDKETR